MTLGDSETIGAMRSFERQVHAFREELRDRGYGAWRAGLFLHLMLWKVGIEVRPPFYMSRSSVVVLFGGYFAVAWGLLMWLFYWRHENTSLLVVIGISVFAGLLFGWMTSLWFGSRVRKLGLPENWDAFADR